MAIYLADSLTSEASPDVVTNDHQATNSLIKRQILSRTADGRIRFDHDLLADWARVMHLRSLGGDVLEFIRKHSENPPWLRAVRLFSQHLLERVSDHDRWQTIIEACRELAPGQKEPASRDLQIIDTWLEGIAYCSEPASLLVQNRKELFADNAWLLKRLLRRLLRNATIPDPIVQRKFRTIDPDTADYAALHHRLPVVGIWLPFISFIIENKENSTDLLPVVLAEIGLIWGQFAEYLEADWNPLAEVILLNAEKELRREVAGAYRHDRGSTLIGGGTNSRAVIYSAALKATSQNPDRGATLALKAAGRIEWEQGDLTEEADEKWRGEWQDRSPFGGWGSRVIEPVEAWPEGPRRAVSRDFAKAWLEGSSSLPLFSRLPEIACEVTLAFLIDWPKRWIRKDDHDISSDSHGFRFLREHFKSAFWSIGPFIGYLRADWRHGVELVIRLTNFATDCYGEWWPYSPGVESVIIRTPEGEVVWRGNHQVFAWNRYHMNTSEVVSCALMALERWFDERVEAGQSVSEAIGLLFRDGRSLALAGVLISVGKRHDALLAAELKPLLFLREIYHLDLVAIQQSVGIGSWPPEGEFVFNAKREWNNLPGRKEWLRDMCKKWMLTKPEFSEVFLDVSDAWKLEFESLPEGSEVRKDVERWAVEFDPRLWKKIVHEDGRIEFVNERLGDFQDPSAEKENDVALALLTLPNRCAELIEKRQPLDPAVCEYIWSQIQNDDFFDHARGLSSVGSEESKFMDWRHSFAGMLAVIVCLGEEWLYGDSSRSEFVDAEFLNILKDPPKVTAYTAEDIRDDFEGFLARVAVRRWATNPKDPNWRATVARFVAAFRYRTVRCLFDEAFRCRTRLGNAYRELEGFALLFSSIREKSTERDFLGNRDTKEDLITVWLREWVPRFASGDGPRWTDDWASIGAKREPAETRSRS